MKNLKNSTIFFFTMLLITNFCFGQAKEVKVIEIRNYLLKEGQRDAYIEGFETYLMDTLNAEGNYVLGQYRVKDQENNFVWIRGFDDMATRKEALKNFFGTQHWEKYKYIPINHIVNASNVYLIKPLDISAENKDEEISFETKWFGQQKGVAVIDFYIANEMRDQLIDFVKTKYDSLLHANGVEHITYWISENKPHDTPTLPAFQDKNLLVTISFFKNENEYQAITKKIKSKMDEDTKFTLNRLVTKKETWILYPTKKSFRAGL